MKRLLWAALNSGCWGAIAGSLVGCGLAAWVGLDKLSATTSFFWGTLGGLLAGALLGVVLASKPE